MIQPRHTGGYTPQNQTALDVATLFVSNEAQPARAVVQIKVSSIRPDDSQPRRNMVGLQDLANSLNLEGQIQPIKVRRVQARPPIEFELIYGERRWRASQLAGREYIDAIIEDVPGETERDIAEKKLELQVAENIQREDFSLADICRSITRFNRDFKRTYKYIAQNHFAPLSKGKEDWVGDRARAWKNADFATRELMEQHSDVFSHVALINSVTNEKLKAALIVATKDGSSVADLRDMISQAEAEAKTAATVPSAKSIVPTEIYPTGAKVDAIVSTNAGNGVQPTTTQADFEQLFDFAEKPQYSAQSVNNSLSGIHSSLESIERQLPVAFESDEFTELAREALATQLKRVEDKARELRAVLSRTV